MFINCDELELFDFFEAIPVTIGEAEGGEWIYSYRKNNFEIVLLISVYEMCVEISISYNNNIVYNERHNNIIQIKKIDNNLNIYTDGEKIIDIKKMPQIGVIIR